MDDIVVQAQELEQLLHGISGLLRKEEKSELEAVDLVKKVRQASLIRFRSHRVQLVSPLLHGEQDSFKIRINSRLFVGAGNEPSGQCVFLVACQMAVETRRSGRYAVDLLDGVRKSVIDKETALSYVRAAQQYVHATPDVLQQRYPEILQAVESFSEPAPTALSRIAGLSKRHGQSVISVMEHTLAHQTADAFPVGSLPWMYGGGKTPDGV